MKKLTRILGALAIMAVVLALAGCPQRRSIAEINNDPGAYLNKEVTLVGVVHHSFGALGQGVYQLDDGTGTIWVLSQKYGVPSDGSRVGVTGVVIPTLEFAGKSYATGIRETHQRSHP